MAPAPKGERGDRLRAAHGPHRLDAAQLGGKRDQGSSPPSARGGRHRHDLRHPRRPRRQRKHEQGREERRLAAGDVEADIVHRPPELAADKARHRFDHMLSGEAVGVETGDIVAGELDRGALVRREHAPRFGRERRDRHQRGRRAVDPLGVRNQRGPAARAHVLHDRPHRSHQLSGLPLRRAGERRPPLGFPEFDPDQGLHHIIIFSMGSTRIADAPAPLSFCSVSQKTDSWQTA
jgi:hypothetical protein